MAQEEGDIDFKADIARGEEFGRLLGNSNRERDAIEYRGNTDPQQLDRHLSANVDFYQWRAHHPLETDPVGAREKFGIELLRYRRVLNGSYYREKADYCDEMAQGHKRFVAHLEEDRLEDDSGVDPQKMIADIALERTIIANWLRTEANCLEMPIEKAPQVPKSDNES